MVNTWAPCVARCSRSWKSVHERGEEVGGWRFNRQADPVALGLLSFRSGVDAEREGLHVEAEAAHRAAGKQFKRPGARACARAVGRRGLEVPAGGARVRDQ